jgi:hypothetical protein
LAEIAQIDGMLGRREHEGARFEHIWERTGIIFWIGRYLSKGDVAGRVDEFAEVAIGDRGTVQPEAIYRNAMNRRFSG